MPRGSGGKGWMPLAYFMSRVRGRGRRAWLPRHLRNLQGDNLLAKPKRRKKKKNENKASSSGRRSVT